jgi:hypothetical protein
VMQKYVHRMATSMAPSPPSTEEERSRRGSASLLPTRRSKVHGATWPPQKMWRPQIEATKVPIIAVSGRSREREYARRSVTANDEGTASAVSGVVSRTSSMEPVRPGVEGAPCSGAEDAPRPACRRATQRESGIEKNSKRQRRPGATERAMRSRARGTAREAPTAGRDERREIRNAKPGERVHHRPPPTPKRTITTPRTRKKAYGPT